MCGKGIYKCALKRTETDSIEGRRFMRGCNGKLCFSDKESGKVWNEYMERIMNEENDWDHNVEGDAVEGPVVCVCREELLQVLHKMKPGKDPGPSKVSLELIAASGGVRIKVMAEICQKVLDGMSAEWSLSIVVPIFMGNGDIRNCSCYQAVKLLEHDVKVVERVLEKRFRRVVFVDEMQFGFMPVR